MNGPAKGISHFHIFFIWHSTAIIFIERMAAKRNIILSWQALINLIFLVPLFLTNIIALFNCWKFDIRWGKIFSAKMLMSKFNNFHILYGIYTCKPPEFERQHLCMENYALSNNKFSGVKLCQKKWCPNNNTRKQYF